MLLQFMNGDFASPAPSGYLNDSGVGSREAREMEDGQVVKEIKGWGQWRRSGQ
jgi:hypothetical protein